jgi:hypothetical protein
MAGENQEKVNLPLIPSDTDGHLPHYDFVSTKFTVSVWNWLMETLTTLAGQV